MNAYLTKYTYVIYCVFSMCAWVFSGTG